MEEQKQILVVGGNGFIGSHIINHALELGWKITNLSLHANSKVTHRDIHNVFADITNRTDLNTALGSIPFDYVVNCGGYIDHSLFYNGGYKVFDVHFNGVLNLAGVLDRARLKSFVNIGSSDEYGNSSAPQIESQREAPISPYSLGKVAATHFLQMLYRTENFPSTTLRLFLVYGPGQDKLRFLPQVIQGCLEGKYFPTSSGEQLRDFCYVEDVVNAVFTTFSSENAPGEVFNIASGKPVTIKKMIEYIRNQIGKGEPLFGKIAYRKGENMGLYADITKAEKLLQWQPNKSLDEGLEKTIRWYKEQL